MLEKRGSRLHLAALDRLDTHSEILPWLLRRIGKDACFVGLDAPVIVTNQSGMREADKLTHRLFGKQNGGAYPVHLGMDFMPGIAKLIGEFRQSGFATNLPVRAQANSRNLFEVYPHAASLRLFGLDKVLPYKKGKRAERLDALCKFQRLLGSGLRHRVPAFTSGQLPHAEGSLTELKAAEDRLDAVLCAYIAAHFWHWGLARNNILGSEEAGYIVVPSF